MDIQPMRVRGMVFDYDGPLALSFVPGIRLLLGLARAKGLIFEPSRVVRLLIRHWGMKGNELLAQAFGIPIEEATALYSAWSELERHTPYALSPDADKTLRLLHEAGVVLTILTSRPEDSFRIGFDQMGIKQYFAHIVTTCRTPHHKPDPRSLDCTMELMGTHDIREDQCLFVGDTYVDVMTMENRGMKGFIVQTGPYEYSMQHPFPERQIIPSTSHLIPRLQELGCTFGKAA